MTDYYRVKRITFARYFYYVINFDHYLKELEKENPEIYEIL